KNTPRFSSQNTSEISSASDHTVPYGTVLAGWGCSRHFVPGYDRTVPPGLRPFLRGINPPKLALSWRHSTLAKLTISAPLHTGDYTKEKLFLALFTSE